MYFLFALFCIALFCGIITAISDYSKQPKCIHGVRNAKRIRTFSNKMKCLQCQQIFEQEKLERELQQEKERVWRENRRIIKERFQELFQKAVEQRMNLITVDKGTIMSMSPNAFEDMVAVLLRRMGYQVRQTPYSNDGGKDAFAEKDGKKYLVECKRYKESARIGRPFLQKLFAAMNENHIENGIFVSTCFYSKDALMYGERFGITTVDFQLLLDWLHRYKIDGYDDVKDYSISCQECGGIVTFQMFNDQRSKRCDNGHEVFNLFFGTAIGEPLCPLCGGHLHLVHGYRGSFYGCSAYPKCRYKLSREDYDSLIGKRR